VTAAQIAPVRDNQPTNQRGIAVEDLMIDDVFNSIDYRFHNSNPSCLIFIAMPLNSLSSRRAETASRSI